MIDMRIVTMLLSSPRAWRGSRGPAPAATAAARGPLRSGCSCR